MAARRLITMLLLTWTLGLGFIRAGVQPAYEMRREAVPACDAGCPAEREAAPQNCLEVCMVWCATAGFHAVSEAEAVAHGPDITGRKMRPDDFQGEVRCKRPLLPPPRV